MRLAEKAVTSKDKSYRQDTEESQVFPQAISTGEYSNGFVRNGGKNLLHQSEQSLMDGLGEKKNQRNFSFLLIPKKYSEQRSSLRQMGTWGIATGN